MSCYRNIVNKNCHYAVCKFFLTEYTIKTGGKMGELSKNIGKRIKKIRESRGIKQCSLAEKLNMEPSNLTRIESGYQFPKEENLQKIAENLDVKVKDLFDFPENLTKDEMLDEISLLISKFNIEDVQFLHRFIKLYELSR